METAYAYNTLKDAVSRITTTRGATVLLDLDYEFYDSGDVKSITHHESGPTGAGTTRYQYDALGRLTQDTANGYGAAVLNTATTYAWSPRGDIGRHFS